MVADVITTFMTDKIKFSNNELAIRKKASNQIDAFFVEENVEFCYFCTLFFHLEQ